MGITDAKHPEEGITLHEVSHEKAGLQTSGKMKYFTLLSTFVSKMRINQCLTTGSEGLQTLCECVCSTDTLALFNYVSSSVIVFLFLPFDYFSAPLVSFLISHMSNAPAYLICLIFSM